MTDDERREVARRLRDEAKHGEMHTRDFLGALCACIKTERNAYRALLLLADLIEPSGYECVPGECPLNARHDNDRIDRDALLALADELEEDACWEVQTPGDTSGAWRLKDACDRIREALGVVE